MSFKQIYEFFNLCLNKSFLRKRTRHAENDIFLMQNELKKLENSKSVSEIKKEKMQAIQGLKQLKLLSKNPEKDKDVTIMQKSN